MISRCGRGFSQGQITATAHGSGSHAAFFRLALAPETDVRSIRERRGFAGPAYIMYL